MADSDAVLQNFALRQCRYINAASERSTTCTGPLWARTSFSPLLDLRSLLSWRTASTVRQHRLDVDALCNTQSIFQFDAKVTHCAIYLRMAEQKLHSAKVARLAVYLSGFGPA